MGQQCRSIVVVGVQPSRIKSNRFLLPLIAGLGCWRGKVQAENASWRITSRDRKRVRGDQEGANKCVSWILLCSGMRAINEFLPKSCQYVYALYLYQRIRYIASSHSE